MKSKVTREPFELCLTRNPATEAVRCVGMLFRQIRKRIFFVCAVSCCIAAMRCTAAVTQNVTLAWDQDNDPHIPVIGYTFYYGTLSGIPYSNWVYVADVTNTTVTVSNLFQGATYYFAVSAMGSNWVESALAT